MQIQRKSNGSAALRIAGRLIFSSAFLLAAGGVAALVVSLLFCHLLTMAELLGMVADMRTKDVRAIQEFGKYVPAFAAFEKNRLSLYREAAQEAEDILNRWEDEIDEDDEPDEYFSD